MLDKNQVEVKRGKIVSVVEGDDWRGNAKSKQVIEYGTVVVMPGLIDVFKTKMLPSLGKPGEEYDIIKLQKQVIEIAAHKVYDIYTEWIYIDTFKDSRANKLFFFSNFYGRHAHLDDPGITEWEGFSSRTRAVAAGGITTIIGMPLNSFPYTVSKETQKKLLNLRFLGRPGPKKYI